MPASDTRYNIVVRALQQSGRGMELAAQTKDLLNDLLEDWALGTKWPLLKRTGPAQTLAAGSTTATLPTDFGAGMDDMPFGNENIPLDYVEAEEFSSMYGFPSSTASNGRPRFYTVDLDAGVFRFNCAADQNYPFIPIYFRLPSRIPTDQTGDNTKPWFPNTKLIIEGLIESIYQFKEDEREFEQHKKVRDLMEQFKLGQVPLKARVTLNRSVFPRVRGSFRRF